MRLRKVLQYRWLVFAVLAVTYFSVLVQSQSSEKYEAPNFRCD